MRYKIYVIDAMCIEPFNDETINGVKNTFKSRKEAFRELRNFFPFEMFEDGDGQMVEVCDGIFFIREDSTIFNFDQIYYYLDTVLDLKNVTKGILP